MKELIGKMTASLAREEQSGHEGLIATLNANIKPPEPIDESMVYIRAMYIVSDQVNSYGGRFPAEEHDRLARLLIDSPVLVGHRKDSLPIARNFHAEKVMRDGANWIKVYFYWLKNAEGGENLRKNIDAGIYKEGSISFVFALPECTICGRDIRDCPHQPFVKYETPAGTVTAAFNYRNIERVLETSLVYRGSVENTSIEKALVFDPHQQKPSIMPKEDDWYARRNIIWSQEALEPDREYLVFPAYESIPVLIEVGHDQTRIRSYSGRAIESPQLRKFIGLLTWPDGDYVLDGRLIGYRGKERQPLGELSKFLHGDKSTVTRMELKLYDIISMDDVSFAIATGRERRAALAMLFNKADGLLPKSVTCSGAQLATALADIATRFGCEIFDLESRDRFLLTHRKLIFVKSNGAANDDSCQSSLSCTVDGTRRAISAELPRSMPVPSGGTMLLEVNGLYEQADNLMTLHPRVVDWSDYMDGIDDLACVVRTQKQIRTRREYVMFMGDDGAFLEYSRDGAPQTVFIRNFSMAKLRQGRRFLAQYETVSIINAHNIMGKGPLIKAEESAGCIHLTLSGFLDGTYYVRPARINGRDCLLFGQGGTS